MRKQLLITGLCCGLIFTLSAPATMAQSTDQTTDHQRIQELEARVAALEQRLDAPPATPPAVSQRQPSVTAAPIPAASPAQPTPPARATPAPAVAAPPAAYNWSNLQRGMSPREVTAQIGSPERRQVRPMSEIWFYPDDRQIEFDNNNRLESWSKP